MSLPAELPMTFRLICKSSSQWYFQ